MKKYIFFLFLPAVLWAQKPTFVTAKVDAATVYFNAAEISQSANVELPAGTNEIVIKNVSEYLNESTVLIGAPPSVTVLSVQFTKNYISEYDKDEQLSALKSVRDSIKLIQNQLAQIGNEKNAVNKTLELLDKNQQVYGANSGLNILDLTKMVDYYKTKRTELSNNLLALNEKETNLNDLRDKLNSKLSVNESKAENISNGKLILQVMNTTAGNIPLKINYLSGAATWSPFYDLRADNVSSPINMLYKAQVTQNTGIDWKKVKLTLSSGTPSQSNQIPELNRWFLRYYNPYVVGNYSRAKDTVSVDIQEVVVMGGIKSKNRNKSTAEISEEDLRTSTVNSEIKENQLNVTFEIDIPYDILSNGKQHSVALKDLKIPASYKYYAVPRLDPDAFLMAEIGDYSKYNLLKGEANIIFENMYVGKTFINPNDTADTLRLGMGKDKRISIKREKIADKSGTKFFSSYKEQTFTYEISVRNNKKDAVELTLKDQFPLSTNKEITIDLLEDGNASVDKDSGYLSWEMKLAPNESRKLRFSYKIRSPKDKTIENL
ncbi:MAG: DUF4139 domain-containing protein [Flavobacteriaceae bacterium]|jgi:uncharacterized protein (TIGR02231 family)|nr:DUF4139 domain-containing protein [Flavobacteriaceae bacterium]